MTICISKYIFKSKYLSKSHDLQFLLSTLFCILLPDVQCSINRWLLILEAEVSGATFDCFSGGSNYICREWGMSLCINIFPYKCRIPLHKFSFIHLLNGYYPPEQTLLSMNPSVSYNGVPLIFPCGSSPCSGNIPHH